MSKVFVAAAGLVPVGEHWRKSIADLMTEASLEAMNQLPDAKPDRIIVGNMLSAVGAQQEQLGALLASQLNLVGVPAYTVEAACGSGGAAVHNGYLSIKAGESDAVLVCGVEKMKDIDVGKVTGALVMADSAEYTEFPGATFVSLNAICHALYLKKYGVLKEEMAGFPVLGHRNAALSRHAMFKRAITVEDVLRSPMISDPIRLMDSSPVCDGAAALLLLSEAKAKELGADSVEMVASEVAANIFSIYERADPLDYLATRTAARRAFEKTGLRKEQVDFMEIHDAFSVTGALTLECLGVSKPGKAPHDVSSGRFDLQGELPINTFGGLKGRGHPVGATGVYQVAETYLQLAEKADGNQVKGAKLGLAHNMGGVDTTTSVHILRRAA
ncbi:MAG TPA: beta-ketoacyl synthase N-terminal-like domain-containing protein [Conexivisphaerales archaeon]|nr:beta-ketoacyl synthase N-terminal-like domain-containing protein [Conexivisphaerales archaeon]